MEPVPRTDAQIRETLNSELRRLEPRREALGESGVFAVAGWTLQMGLEWEAALLAWTRAAETAPHEVEPVFAQGVCLLEMGRYAAAAERFREARELDERIVASGGEGLDWMEDDPAYRLGTALHAQGELRAALAAYEESARRNEITVDALREMVRVRIVLGEPHEALEAVTRLERRAVRLTVRAEAMAFRAEVKAMLRGAQHG